MGMTEKESLINELTIKFVEDYNLNLREVKAKITEALQNYHVKISDERFTGEDVSTEYLLKKFTDGKLAAGMSENCVKQYKIAVQTAEKYCGKMMADIEPEDIINFFKSYSKVVSSVTVKAKYQLLSSIYNWLFMHKFLSYNPIAYVDTPKAKVIYKEPLSDFNLEKIKQVCENLPKKENVRDMALIHFFISSGCRVSEVAKIQLKDVDFENKTCKVLGKGRKERPVIITDAALFRLKKYLELRKNVKPEAPLFATIRGKENFLTKDGLEKIVRKLTKTAGIKNVTCHSFRRYYATELRKRNVNIQMIASSLGHANLNQINRYSLYGTNEMLEQIRKSV